MEKYGLIANTVMWVSINESLEEIFCFETSRVLCLKLLDQPVLWMKPSVQGILTDFVNNLVWKGIMNTFDDIGRYGKGHYRDNRPTLMM